ncbi:MAG: cytidylate kinase-like family protein [Lachnospiraceae bacterium]|jgi:cytidylate kinase|nr:cytidylate kinase-like family protein [Lachnospiraceae bacterium]
MANHTVFTIGRQYGSGGHDIGIKLAEELKIPCYDKELLARAAKESGLCQELFENHDEKPTNSFLYSLVMDTYSTGYSSAAFADMPINHKVFLAQFDTIKKIAQEGPCVIVGRCADYALAEVPNVINIFLNADLQSRIVRIARRHDITDAKAKDMIIKTDKHRASYYNYYTSKKWGDAAGYDLCLNTSTLGIDGTIHIIREFAMYKEKEHDKI